MILTSSGTAICGDFRNTEGSTTKAPGIASRLSLPRFFFEVQQVEHRDLAVGFQFACEHRRTDAAQP